MNASYTQMTLPGDLSMQQVEDAFADAQAQGGFLTAIGLQFMATADVMPSIEHAEDYLARICLQWKQALCVRARDARPELPALAPSADGRMRPIPNPACGQEVWVIGAWVADEGDTDV